MGRFAKKNVKSLEDVEKWLAGESKIRLDVTREESSITFDELFTRMVINQEETFRPRGGYQCGSDRYRSIQDFVLAVKYYFPDMSYIDIMHKIGRKLVKAHKANAYFRMLRHCPTVRKFNFGPFTYLGNYKHSYYYTVESIEYDLSKLFPNMHGSDKNNLIKSLKLLWEEDVEGE